MGCNLVGNQALLHVVAVRQAQVFLGRHVTQHGCAIPADVGRAHGRRDMVVAWRDVGDQRAECVERRFETGFELFVHVLFHQLQRHVAGAFDHHLHIVFPRDLRQLTQRVEFSKLGFIVGVGNGARAQAVAKRETHVVRFHDLADVVEVFVQKTFTVVRQTPLRHDRATPRHDARQAVRGEWHIGQAHTGVDGEVVHTLLGLLDQCVAENFPRQIFGLAVHLLQRLVNRHRADGHGRVAQDPFTGLVDVVTGRQIHHRVRTPADRPHQFVHLFLDARRDGRVADVGVHLDEEVAANNHRLALGVVDVVGDHRPAARHFVTHKFGGYFCRDGRVERVAFFRQPLGGQALGQLRPHQVLTYRDVLHLGCDDAAPRIVHL